MTGKAYGIIMDREKIPHLIFYCLGFSIAIFTFGVQAALVLALFIMTVVSFSYLIAELYLRFKNTRTKNQTTNSKVIVSGLLTLLFTVLGMVFFTKLMWGYAAVLIVVVLLTALCINWRRKRI